MNCTFQKNASDKYSTNLRIDPSAGKLVWDSSRGQDVLIVQLPYGKRIGNYADELANGLKQLSSLPSSFTEIIPGIWICFVSASDRVKNNGCSLNGEASTYTILPCDVDGNEVVLSFMENQSMIRSYVDVPMDIGVTVKMETTVKGWIRKITVPTGFYSVSFRPGSGDRLLDGSLCISINGFEVPITRKMLNQGTVFVETDIPPEITAKKEGLRIVNNKEGFAE